MPCQSDYLAQSGQELESNRVCTLLIYLYACINKQAPQWVREAADDYYGNVNRLDEATKMLCDCCRILTESETELFIYNAHNRTARNLAAWWERHQEWDRRRVAEEKETRKRIVTRDRALKKLTVEEMKALGLT